MNSQTAAMLTKSSKASIERARLDSLRERALSFATNSGSSNSTRVLVDAKKYFTFLRGK